MEHFHFDFLLLFFVLFGGLYLFNIFYKHRSHSTSRPLNLPPGSTGLPFIGETLEFLSMGWKGKPEKFIFNRISKFSSEVFKTHILGVPVAFLCGADGNKFLFSNENKLVALWWPDSVNKVFPLVEHEYVSPKKTRKLAIQFLKPEALQNYIDVMDKFAQTHFASSWEKRDKVVVLSLAKRYTFFLACKLFLSLEDPSQIAKLEAPFSLIPSGIVSVPIDLPGTSLNKAKKASKFIQNEILFMIKQRKIDLGLGKSSNTQDILSHMLTTCDEDGMFMKDEDIAIRILGLLIAGHTATVVCTWIVKYLAEHPNIYQEVYCEQMEITKSKEEGELLDWDDLLKMKYSWNVVCEVMRLVPVQASFREAIHDFEFKGFHIPKGWKLCWSSNATHRDPNCFPEPERFDPSRFEGDGPAPYTYIPFGGGPRMCPGKEYARLEILVFMHHLVKRFKWEKMFPDEKTVVDLMPIPAQGLPIRLYTHAS